MASSAACTSREMEPELYGLLEWLAQQSMLEAGFAKKHAQLMPRKRYEMWGKGKRVHTGTWYKIPDPTTSVVELRDAHLKRA
jgi:hypothetical protein